MKGVIVAGVLCVTTFLGIHYAVNEGVRRVATAAATDQAAACLTMLGSTTTVDNGFTYIIGSIRNDCDRKFDNVTIAFKVDSGSASELTAPMMSSYGSKTSAPKMPTPSKMTMPDSPILAYAKNIKPGETQKFKSYSHIGKNATVRFDGIKGF
jgi:hypothetical protein